MVKQTLHIVSTMEYYSAEEQHTKYMREPDVSQRPMLRKEPTSRSYIVSDPIYTTF